MGAVPLQTPEADVRVSALPPTVLIVDDDPDMRLYLRAACAGSLRRSSG
jgi:hypothetical protein